MAQPGEGCQDGIGRFSIYLLQFRASFERTLKMLIRCDSQSNSKGMLEVIELLERRTFENRRTYVRRMEHGVGRFLASAAQHTCAGKKWWPWDHSRPARTPWI